MQIMNPQNPNINDANKAYEKYVKPLEQKHRGKFAGVSYTGKVIIAPSLYQAMLDSKNSFGRANSFVFKIGDKVVGRLL